MIYTNRGINLISILITIILFFIINNMFFNKNIPNYITDIKENIRDEITELKDNNIINNNEENEDYQDITNNYEEIGDWYIEIPSINLKAPISEGTNLEVLNKYVGHFEDTSSKNGNIGLAAHNRGYEKNYFENLKSVKIGENIIYTNGDYKKIYSIDKIEIIKNTDWSYLEETDENKITLITCVENEPQYRRCVQAIEIEN